MDVYVEGETKKGSNDWDAESLGKVKKGRVRRLRRRVIGKVGEGNG